MKSHELQIEGMTCGHCVMSVKKELTKLENVVVEEVQIGKARVKYDEAKVMRRVFEQAVEGAGYKLVGVN
ncbi:MAG TPA: heavy-metal-associated domain-containing protein [Bacteroidota bacterium]|nr:heavy-metal-associated domain-containing protein [Bacteroidota bacterium]